MIPCASRSCITRPITPLVCSASLNCNKEIQEHERLHRLARIALYQFEWFKIDLTSIKNQSEAPVQCKPKAPVQCKPKAPAQCKPKAHAQCKPKAPAKCKPKAPAQCKPKAPAQCKPKALPTKVGKLIGEAARAEVLRIGATANTFVEVYPKKGVAKSERWYMRVDKGNVIWKKSKPYIAGCRWCRPNSLILDDAYPSSELCLVASVNECNILFI